eukprot:scaffold4502_cov36-Phaeocystis_antarctica.AAC.1
MSSRRSRRSGCTEPGIPSRNQRRQISKRTSLGTCSRRETRLDNLAPAARAAAARAAAARAAAVRGKAVVARAAAARAAAARAKA